MMVLFGTGMLAAQAIRFSGYAGITAGHEFIQGDSLRIPTSEVRLVVNPTLTIYELPLSLNLLLSSRESNLRQALNRFVLGLRPEELLKQKARIPAFASFIRGIEFGTCTPYYSPLTLAAVPVTGGAIELNPGPVYLAATLGRNRRAIEGSDTTTPVYSRMLYSGRFGFGRKEKTHFYLTLLHGRDDSGSVRNNKIYRPYATPPDSLEIVVPAENYLLGAEFNLALFQDRFRLESEITGSEFTRDVRMAEVSFDAVPDWAERLIHPRPSSGFDFAYSIKPSLTLFGTRIAGVVKTTGPGYRTMGTPSLRSDDISYRGSLSRSFAGERLSVALNWGREHDNLIGMKQTTTWYTSYGADIGLNLPRLPYLQLSFSPWFQQNAAENNRSFAVSLSSGHSFETSGIIQSPGLSSSYRSYRTTVPVNDYSSFDLWLRHSLAFKSPLAISASAGLTRTSRPAGAEQTVSLELTPSYTILRNWRNSITLGGSLGTSSGQYPSPRQYRVRLGSSLPAGKIADVTVSIEQNGYTGPDGAYQDLRIAGSLSRVW